MATGDGAAAHGVPDIGSPADAVGVLGSPPVTQRLDMIERVLFALARAQGIDPAAS
ncbi:hypothetical protein [Streptomyces acidicola]|uniref:hypothetical protein n=1 Tax=Streptomyces acidicola TaxID=2596892 RepID=UPI001883282F|nr:hypothetical protein [Streptomyces acidicola]